MLLIGFFCFILFAFFLYCCFSFTLSLEDEINDESKVEKIVIKKDESAV